MNLKCLHNFWHINEKNLPFNNNSILLCAERPRRETTETSSWKAIEYLQLFLTDECTNLNSRKLCSLLLCRKSYQQSQLSSGLLSWGSPFMFIWGFSTSDTHLFSLGMVKDQIPLNISCITSKKKSIVTDSVVQKCHFRFSPASSTMELRVKIKIILSYRT